MKGQGVMEQYRKNNRFFERCLFLVGALMVYFLMIDTSKVSAKEEFSVYTKTDFAMDTVLSETLYTTGEDITEEIVLSLREVEQELLSWTQESSQIYQLNQNAGSWQKISEGLAGYLEQILKLSKDSDGAMDPTMGEVIRLWDIDGEDPHVPDAQSLEELLKNVGYEKVVLKKDQVILPEGMTLDLGAAGKGIGCDEIQKVLDQHPEISGAIINLGGSSVMTYKDKPDGSLWQIAVTDPRDTQGDYLGVVALNGTEFLSTSGDYEKYFVQDGIRYHHILDPNTGYPAQNGLTSVTVVCKNGLEADALSTACFVLGREKAQKLLEIYEADGLFVDDSGNVFLTDGMKERFQLLKDTYSICE